MIDTILSKIEEVLKCGICKKSTLLGGTQYWVLTIEINWSNERNHKTEQKLYININAMSKSKVLVTGYNWIWKRNSHKVYSTQR